MIRKFLLLIIICLPFSHAYSQSVEGYVNLVRKYKISNPDSAIYFAQKAQASLQKKTNHYLSAKMFNALGIAYWVNGDTKSADSLLKLALKHVIKDGNDTLHIYILNNTSLIQQSKGNIDKALVLYREALSIGKQKKLFLEVADTYNNIASIHMDIGHVDSAEINYQLGIDYCKLIDNNDLEREMMEADLNTNLGALYDRQGKRNLAFTAFFNGLNLYEKNKEWSKCATVALNIGEAYFNRSNYNKALQYAWQSLKYTKEMNTPINHGNAYYLIGKSYFEMKQLDSAEYYDLMAIDILEKSENYIYLGHIYNSLGVLYTIKKNKEKALEYFDKVVAHNKELNDNPALSVNYENLSILYFEEGDLVKAKEYIDLAMEITNPKEHITGQISVLNTATTIYEALGRYKEALQFLILHNRYVDTLAEESNNRIQEEIEAIYQNEKKQKEIERQNAINEKKSLELKLSEEQGQAKSFQLKLVLVGGLLLLLAMILVVRSNLQRKKTNKLLAQKNNIIYKQKEEVEIQREELHLKNHIIEEKQKEILDSINYAKRIQYTLLANEELMNQNLPEHFVFFQPKDIVSGDFYWATQHKDSFYLAICDSTGHGVPGAFMSLLNISFLNEAINEKNIEEPGKVLDYVRMKLIENISQDGGQDGMDGILIQLSKKNDFYSLSFAAAHNAPIIIRGNEVIHLGFDKMPIGKSEKKDAFKTYSFQPQRGDLLFMFTDGYPDQFGGEKGKKLKLKNLIEMLKQIQSKPLVNQKDILVNNFNDWKGDLEQVDDVLLACIKF